MNKQLTPNKIVEALDKYIIGQAEAKKAVAIALRNRWRRLQAPKELQKEIIPNNILMIGPTGVGKTEIARRLADLAQAPFIKVEASKFTEVGYVGRDVESMIRDLVEQSVNMVRAEKKTEVKQKALENANELILDILIPPIEEPARHRFDQVSETSEGEKDAQAEQALNARTRERFRNKLLAGELEGKEIEIEVSIPTTQVQVMGPMGLDGMEGLEDLIKGMVPKKQKLRKMPISEAREYLVEEEAGRLIDMDVVTREALFRAGNSGIIFIDEIDKIAVNEGRKGGADVSREGVQRDLLPIIEGSVVSTKYGTVKTDHILFVAAGAFHVARPSDLIPELQGRLPIRVELNSLTKEDFVEILSKPKNALTKQYEALLASEGVSIVFEPESITEMADIAFEVNQEVENIGARRLHTIMSNLLNDILFEVPDQNEQKKFSISKDFVRSKLGQYVAHKDLSHYIL